MINKLNRVSDGHLLGGAVRSSFCDRDGALGFTLLSRVLLPLTFLGCNRPAVFAGPILHIQTIHGSRLRTLKVNHDE